MTGIKHLTGLRRMGWAGLRHRVYAQIVTLFERISLSGEHGLLWLPGLFGAGIGLYFALPFEPVGLYSGVLAVLAGLAALILPRGPGKLVALGALLVAAGFLAGILRTHSVAAPVLAGADRMTLAEGVVQSVEEGDALRIVLAEVHLDRVSSDATPARIRVSVRTSTPELEAGDRVRLRAILNPPPGPAYPGGYNFARALWFEGIGATGFAISDVEVVEPGETNGWHTAIENLRARVASRARDVIGGDAGDVAAALLTGKRRAISAAVQEDMRRAGLAHLLAISGLHLALVTGFVFFALRAAFAAVPRLALDYPIKSWAAVGAWAAGLGYFFLSGAGVSTQRAFIMVSVALLAVITGRRVISMRTVALAALIVLLVTPEALLSVSFQMSFAAVIGLVAAYRRFGAVFTGGRGRNVGMLKRAAGYLLAVALTTLVAELAIAPFASYHFHRVSLVGIPANLLAVPVMGLWVMPAGIVALALEPVGLDAPFLQLMGQGLDIVLWTARSVTAVEPATLAIPAYSAGVLILLIAAGFMLVLGQGRRTPMTAAVATLVAALSIAAAGEQPVLLADRSGTLFAARMADGTFAASDRRKGRFDRGEWASALAQPDLPHWREIAGGDRVGCDQLGCIYRVMAGRRTLTVSLPARREALAGDCRRADAVIAGAFFISRCDGPAIILDRDSFTRNGAHALFLRGGKLTTVSAGEIIGDRPWNPGHGE